MNSNKIFPIKPATIISHLLFWAAYLGFIVFIFSGRFPLEWALQRALLLGVIQAPLVYLNMGVYVPYFLEKKKYLIYILLCLLSIVAVYYLYEYFTQPDFERASRASRGGRPPQSSPNAPFLRFDRPSIRGLINIFMSSSLLLFSSIIKMAQLAAVKEKEAALLRGENLNSELKFLKAQINPHFLFNTLNNIYSLSMIKSDKAPDMIMKLSDMLRYILYECSDKDKVPVAKEVAYIHNYIDLQLLKDSGIKNVHFDENIRDNVSIAPMLLIPFIENGFKHSRIEDTENGWIHIKLETSRTKIDFHMENSLPQLEYSKDKTGGIGIENARRRLELLYPGNYKLEIEKKETVFVVSLHINL